MASTRRIRLTEVLLLLPAILLGIVAVGLRGKSEPSGRFKFTIKKIEFSTLPSPTPANWRMEITIYLGHTGQTPQWWGQPGHASYCLCPTQFIGRGGKVYRAGASAAAGWLMDPFDATRQEYVMRTIVNTAVARSRMQPATFKGIVGVTGDVRQPMVWIPVSQVIRDS